MEFDQVKIAILAIVALEVLMGAMSVWAGDKPDVGTIGMGLTGIAGLAGYDMGKKQ